MIEQKAARGNIFWFRLYGKLTEEDYKNNLMPELERAAKQYKKIPASDRSNISAAGPRRVHGKK